MSLSKTKIVATLVVLAAATFTPWISATPLSDSESNPIKLGWMQGSPPPKDKLIMQPSSDFFSFPKMRWTVCHMSEVMPVKEVSKGIDAPRTLEYALDSSIDSVQFKPLGSDKSMTWKESLSANYTDGILILHKGKIVYELYSGCLNDLGKHASMSMTKSMTGLLAEILITEGVLNPTDKVKTIIPELTDSAFGNATVQQVMDMTTSLNFSEDYADPNADIWAYSEAASPLPKPDGYEGPNSYFEYLQIVTQGSINHGEAFGYKTVNSDTLGWIISRATGKDITTLLSERIWQKMGAEQAAYMTVDAKGTPFAGGGLNASLRDLGRVGMLMLNGGTINEQRLFSEEVVKNIQAGGDKEAFDKAGFTTLKGGSYRSMWWVMHNKHEAFAARGVHGQTIYVDPTAGMVIVRFSSTPSASNAKLDPTSLPAYQAVAEYLLNK